MSQQILLSDVPRHNRLSKLKQSPRSMKSIGHLEGKLLGIHNQVFVPFSCTPTRFLCDV